jgi:hypothetical protein
LSRPGLQVGSLVVPKQGNGFTYGHRDPSFQGHIHRLQGMPELILAERKKDQKFKP